MQRKRGEALYSHYSFYSLYSLKKLIMTMTEQEWIARGKEAYARMDWKECLDSYAEAIKLNPESEAVELRRMVMTVVEFYSKDRFNP